RWCCLAAEQGLAEAQRQVGDLYHAGHGVTADVAQGDAWHEKAAEQGGCRSRRKAPPSERDPSGKRGMTAKRGRLFSAAG
ncbi:MAG TPA: hypothetical protein VGF39_12930, partial [Stellaceae bacterium]